MANFNPLGYTGKVTGSTTRLGVVEFNPTDFSVDENGVVSLGGTGAVQTINSLLPVAGNIIIAGTANQVGIANAGHTVTLSLPAAITAPGSLTTTTTLAAGTALSAGTTITAGTGIVATTGNISASAGAVNAATSMTATAGNITATLGNLVLNGAAKQVQIHGGAVTDFIGQATLVAGSVTVSNTNIAAGDKISVSRRGINGSTALGVFNTAISAATSFTITSLKTSDASTETNDISIVDYVITRQV